MLPKFGFHLKVTETWKKTSVPRCWCHSTLDGTRQLHLIQLLHLFPSRLDLGPDLSNFETRQCRDDRRWPLLSPKWRGILEGSMPSLCWRLVQASRRFKMFWSIKRFWVVSLCLHGFYLPLALFPGTAFRITMEDSTASCEAIKVSVPLLS